MRSAVFILSAITAAGAGILLFRGFVRSRSRLLFWSGVCFLGLAGNSAMLFLDEIIWPQYDLGIIKIAVALAGLAALLYGLIWESR